MIDMKNIDFTPKISEISAYINNPLFDQFYEYMHQEYKAICKIEYSKDVWARGWNVKFRKAGKSLCVIYPKETYFTVLVVISRKEQEAFNAIWPELCPKIQSIYQETKEGMGQRWMMIDIDASNEVYNDVLKLIRIRRECK